MSVKQKYEFTERWNDYKTGTRTIYRGQEQSMDIGKSNNNFKDRKLKYFNYNKYEYMAKKCWLKKKEQETRKCFKCDKDTLPKTVEEYNQWRNKRSRKDQTMKIKKKSRVLAIILSRHGTRDLPCKFPKQIYHSNSLK